MDVYFAAPKLEKAEYSVDSGYVILDHSDVERRVSILIHPSGHGNIS